jgi:hypothetical protein
MAWSVKFNLECPETLLVIKSKVKTSSAIFHFMESRGILYFTLVKALKHIVFRVNMLPLAVWQKVCERTCLALLRLLAGSIQSVYMNLMAARPIGFT